MKALPSFRDNYSPGKEWGYTEDGYPMADDFNYEHEREQEIEASGDRLRTVEQLLDAGDNAAAFRQLYQFTRHRSDMRAVLGGDTGGEEITPMLEELQNHTHSIYLNRFLEYAYRSEIHWWLEERSVLTDDETANLEPPTDASPLEEAMYKRGQTLQQKLPTFGHPDYYPPSPYSHLASQHHPNLQESQYQDGEYELALETMGLFGLSDTEAINDAQYRTALFNTGVNLDQTAYDRISRITNNIASENNYRELFAKAFLATEFGTDYGESILSIAENYPTEQSGEIFETINKFNEHTHAIAQWYDSYDPQLSEAIELAMRERLSDALVALDELGVNGRLDIDVSPGRNSEGYVSDGRFEMHLQSPEEGIEIVKSLGKSLELIRETITAQDVQVHQVNKNDSQFAMYRFSSKQVGDALLYIRPEAAKGYDQQLEYGNRAGVEASISFIVNPTTPHHLDVYKDPQGVSIRFDREGRLVNESPFSSDRDPTRQDGSISVDISSLMGDKQHMPVKIGWFIAAGNLLRAAKTGEHESLHHNNNYFNQARYGTKEGFAKLAVYTAHMATAMIEFQRTGSHASPYPSIPAAQR